METISIKPTWGWAVSIYLEVLNQPMKKSNIQARMDARKEIVKLAGAMDAVIKRLEELYPDMDSSEALNKWLQGDKE